MWRYLDIKTITSALIVAAIVSAIGIWGNSKLLDYKFDQLACEIGTLKVGKVDKSLVDRLNSEIILLKAEKADRALVEARWLELRAGLIEMQGDMKHLIRMHMANQRKNE